MVRRPLGSENGAVEGAEYALHWHQESPLRPGPTLTRAKIGLSISETVWRNHHFFIVTITIIIHIMIINTSTVVVWLWMEQSGTAVRRTTAWSVKACPPLPSSSLLSCLSSLFLSLILHSSSLLLSSRSPIIMIPHEMIAPHIKLYFQPGCDTNTCTSTIKSRLIIKSGAGAVPGVSCHLVTLNEL